MKTLICTGRPRQPKKPLLPREVRHKTIRKLRTEKLKDLQVARLLAIGFTGFLRWDDLKKIHADDVVTTQTHPAIFLESCKNERYKEGSWTFMARTGEKQTYPVTLLERFLKIGKHKGHSKLFCKVCNMKNGQRLRSANMTYPIALELVRKASQKVGLNPRPMSFIASDLVEH